jgi:hypothetical protein
MGDGGDGGEQLEATKATKSGATPRSYPDHGHFFVALIMAGETAHLYLKVKAAMAFHGDWGRMST